MLDERNSFDKIKIKPPQERKPTTLLVRRAKTQTAWASAQTHQSSLCAQWVAKDPRCLHADSEDSDQTGWTQSEAQADLSSLGACHFYWFVELWLKCKIPKTLLQTLSRSKSHLALQKIITKEYHFQLQKLSHYSFDKKEERNNLIFYYFNKQTITSNKRTLSNF